MELKKVESSRVEQSASMSKDDVCAFAIDGSHALLYAAISCHRHDTMTWCQAMQLAAIEQAKALKEARDALIGLAQEGVYSGPYGS